MVASGDGGDEGNFGSGVKLLDEDNKAGSCREFMDE
jgi:hypothetical protein